MLDHLISTYGACGVASLIVGASVGTTALGASLRQLQSVPKSELSACDHTVPGHCTDGRATVAHGILPKVHMPLDDQYCSGIGRECAEVYGTVLLEFALPCGKKARLFEASIESLELLIELEQETWPHDLAAGSSEIRRRLLDPQWTTLFASLEDNSKPVAMYSAVYCTFGRAMKVGPWSFFANTASQSIGGPFKQGDCLHGISLTIQTESLSGLGSAFMRSVATHYGAKGLRFMLDVVRVPGMAKELGQGISPHDYFDGVLLGDHYEAAFGILLSAGWLPLQLAKDYYRDSASADYGLVMVKWLAKE